MHRGLTAVIAALLLLQLAAAVAHAQVSQSGAINPKVVVKESVMRIYVYPDGSIQPYYKLVATVDLGSNANLYGRVLYESRSVLEKNVSTSNSSLNVDITGLHIEKEGGFTATAEWRYRGLSGGGGDAVLSLVLNWWNTKGREKLVVKELRIEAQGGEKATLYLDVLVPSRLLREALREQGLATLTPDEINKKLAASNADYVRVKSLSVTMLGNGTTEVKLIVEEDITNMIERAVANGMPSEDAKELLRLLRSGVQVSGTGELRLSAETNGNRLVASMKTSSSDRGDLTKAELLAQKAMPLLVEAITYLVKPYVEQNPETALVIAQIQTGLQQGVTPIVRVAPSISNTTVKVQFKGRYIDIYVEYYGDRVRVPSSETPGVVAEKTLTLLSQQFSKALQSLGTLQAYIPGLAAVIPNHVELVPLGGVKVSQTRVTLNQLPLIRVTAVSTKTQTTTMPPTQTTSATASSSSSPTPTYTTTTTSTTMSTPTRPAISPSPSSTTVSKPTTHAIATTSMPHPQITRPTGTGGTVSTMTAIAVVIGVLAVVALAAALLLRRSQP